jgi:hypothetical protein
MAASAGARSYIGTITFLGEILTVIGPVGVLGLWLYQQTEMERNSSELRKIASARSIYQTYQSHNAVFNGLNELVGPTKPAEGLRNFQIHNYELGLAALENVLSPDDRKGIPARIHAYGPESYETKSDRIQQRLELLQVKVNEREANVRASADAAQNRYFWIFVGLSLLSIAGAVGKTVQKLAPASASQDDDT